MINFVIKIIHWKTLETEYILHWAMKISKDP